MKVVDDHDEVILLLRQKRVRNLEVDHIRADIEAFTMPGFATGEETKANAWALMRALCVAAEEIDIRPAATRMLQDMGHPFANGEPAYDITFENDVTGVITAGGSSTSITSHTPDPSGAGDPVTVSWNVTGGGTGNVTINDTLQPSITCTAAVAAGSCVINPTTVGVHYLTATYTGDSNVDGSGSVSVAPAMCPDTT